MLHGYTEFTLIKLDLIFSFNGAFGDLQIVNYYRVNVGIELLGVKLKCTNAYKLIDSDNV